MPSYEGNTESGCVYVSPHYWEEGSKYMKYSYYWEFCYTKQMADDVVLPGVKVSPDKRTEPMIEKFRVNLSHYVFMPYIGLKGISFRR